MDKQHCLRYCEAGHFMCHNCAASTVATFINSSAQPSLRCCCWYDVDRCTARVNSDELVKLCNDGKLSAALLTRFQKHEVLEATPENQRVHCPRPGCGVMCIIDEGDRDALNPRNTCPNCHGEFCLSCHVPWHSDVTCKSFQMQLHHKKATLDDANGDAQSHALLNLISKPCSQCPVGNAALLTHYRNHGCHHMSHHTADGSLHEMCFSCGEWPCRGNCRTYCEDSDQDDDDDDDVYNPCSCQICPECASGVPCELSDEY
jgi:hypothetical protein